MNTQKKNYIPFIAGMATMILLACLISASLAREDAPVAQPPSESQVQVQAGDLRLAKAEVGIALFGMERVAPGETLKTENGAEIPAVVTYTDEKGEVHYYVEAQAIGDILDVCTGVTYHDTLNCVDFGAAPFINDKGEQSIHPITGKPVWFTGDVKCDIDYALSINEETGEKTGFSREADFTDVNGITAVAATRWRVPEEERAEWEKTWEEQKKATPLKPEYGVTYGMFTEVNHS